MDNETVHAGSLVTLRYRLSCGEQVLVSTMEDRPSTFQLGTGELAPPLEACLLGLAVGVQQSFELPPNAFGAHNEQLVRRVARDTLPATASIEPGATLTVAIAPGQQASGLIREFDADSVMLDLNHPLAGKSVRFDVDVIGVL